MTDPRIGHRTEQGVEYPSQTLSGRPYRREAQSQPPNTVQLGGGDFAVLDPFPPVGFDRRAALEALRKPPSRSKRIEPQPEPEPESDSE